MENKTYQEGVLEGLRLAEKIFQSTKVLDEVYDKLTDYKDMTNFKIKHGEGGTHDRKLKGIIHRALIELQNSSTDDDPEDLNAAIDETIVILKESGVKGIGEK